MALTTEQVKELKAQLRKQVNNLPEEQKAQAQQQIDEMSSEAIESMLEQQKTSHTKQPIFRSIVSEETPSKKIDENKEAIAVLDIKPISPGHTVIIPKKAVVSAKQIPARCFSLAKKVAKRISLKLKSKSSEIQTEFKFGEIILNVIPVYDKSLNINSPRQEAEEKDLSETYDMLKAGKKLKIIKKQAQKKPSSLIKLKRKIP